MADMEDSVTHEATPVVDDEDKLPIILDPILNSYDALSHAPYIFTSLSHMLLISAEKDFSLRAERLKNATLKYINYPDSFRACVVQVSIDVCRAFNEAHTTMYQISLKSTGISKEVKKAVKFIEKGSKNELKIVFRCLKNIEGQCTECVDVAASITNEFKTVANTMDELIEVCSQSKGTYEEEQNEMSRKKKAAVSKQEQIKKNKETLGAICEREKSEYEEAKEIYDKAFESNQSTWKIMLFGVVGVARDVAIAVLPSILMGKFMPASVPVVSVGKLTEPSFSKPEITNDEAKVNYETMLKEDAEKKRKEAKEFLLECYTRYERSQNKMLQESKEMEKVLGDLATFDHTTLDREKIQDALRESVKALNKVREHWNKFKNLFQWLHFLIREHLKGDVKRFSDTTITANDGLRDGQQIAEITHQTIIQESREAQQISLVVRNISSFYVSAAEQYLLEGMMHLQRIIALDPKTDEETMKEVKKELIEDAEKAKLGIQNIAQNKKRELSKRIENLRGCVNQ